MESKAIAKYIRMSPRKVRQVVDLVRGRQVDNAINILHFTHKAAALPVEKTLRSAVANMMNNDETSKIDTEKLFIKEAFVDSGFTFKRFRAASMGRAMRMKRPSCSVTIVVATTDDNKN